MRVLDTRIHDTSFRHSIRLKPDSSGIKRGGLGRAAFRRPPQRPLDLDAPPCTIGTQRQ
jgi:hypothetical protein